MNVCSEVRFRMTCSRRSDCIRGRPYPLDKLAAAVLVCCFLAIGGDPAAADPGILSETYSYNIAGEVIAIAVGSYTRALKGTSRLITPAVCEERCKGTTGCSAWSYCSKPTGCSGQCREYLRRNPPLRADSKNHNRITRYASLPLVRPGPFAKLCQEDKVNRDNWAYGTCSLWKVQNPAKPFFWSNQASHGWVSGVMSLPLECSGLPISSCSNCLASANFTGCVACARKANGSKALDVVLGTAVLPQPSDACRMCYMLDNPEPCVDCLVRNRPCAVCATSSLVANSPSDQHPGRFFNLPACINCMAQHGKAHARVCDDCSRQRGSQDVTRCMSCVVKFKGRFCATEKQEQEVNHPGKACVPQTQCGLCARSPLHPQCMACASTRPYRRDCVRCMGLMGPDDTIACLSCAQQALPGVGKSAAPCTDCYLLANRTNLALCEQCAKRHDIPAEGRNWCVACTDWWGAPATQKECFDCLSKVSEPKHANACKATPAIAMG